MPRTRANGVDRRLVQPAQQPDNEDDWQGNADQPKQKSASHRSLLNLVLALPLTGNASIGSRPEAVMHLAQNHKHARLLAYSPFAAGYSPPRISFLDYFPNYIVDTTSHHI